MAVKSYRRFEAEEIIGLVSSPGCNIVYDSSGETCYTGMLQEVGRWNLKLSKKIGAYSLLDQQYPRKFGPVESTCIERSSNQIDLAVGYSDGSLCIYDLSNGFLRFTFCGHRGAIACLSFSPNANLLASGSKDTSLIIWDLISEVGLVRLKGHTNMISGLAWLPNNSHIVSSSTDATLKLWNITTGECSQTVSNHLGVEIWSLTIGHQGDCYRLATGASDKKIRIFEVLIGSDDKECELVFMGCLNRNLTQDGRGKCIQVKFHPDSGHVLGVLGSGNILEIFQWRVDDEAALKKRKRRRERRKRNKKSKKLANNDNDDDAAVVVEPEVAEEEEEEVPCSSIGSVASDEFSFVSLARCQGKAKSFDFHPSLRVSQVDGSVSTKLIVGLRNNGLNVFAVNTSRSASAGENVTTDGLSYGNESKLTSSITSNGHESDVRCVCLSHSNTLLASCSQSTLKIWNAFPAGLISSVDVDGCLVCLFGPSDLHVILGTKDGRILMVDVSLFSIICEISAHGNAIWSIDIRLDMTGIVTGSADHDVKLWDFVILNGNLSLENTRTVQLTEDVLCCRFSKVLQNQSKVKEVLAVSTLDNSIKIFFSDSLKFKLTLYGHQLPVLSCDISDDGVMLVSGSADKTLKIWGLDFGDCRKSILAHGDSIMSVRFLPRTHHLVSCSKDKSVKLWDCDEFELIMKLNGNLSPVWSVVVSSDGDSIISAGQDRSIRVWRKSSDLVFVQEERENDLEEEEARRWIQSSSSSQGKRAQDDNKDDEAGTEDGQLTEFQSRFVSRILSEESKAIELTSLSSLQSMRCGERLMEALDVVSSLESDDPTPRTLNLPPLSFIHSVLAGIKAADLEQAVLALRYHHAVQLIKAVCELAEDDDKKVDLCCRCLSLILFIHQTPLQTNIDLIPLLTKARDVIHSSVYKQQVMIGTNIASIKLLKMFASDKKASDKKIV